METNFINIHGENIRLVVEEDKCRVLLTDLAKYLELEPLSDESNMNKVFDFLTKGNFDGACKFVAYLSDFSMKSVKLRLIRMLMFTLNNFDNSV